jgi:SAM-dependent methyltransferase
VRKLLRRAAWSAAVRSGLQVYDPEAHSSYRLDEAAEEVLDAGPIPDKRPSTAWEDVPDLTLVPEALPTVIDVERFRGARVLEVGPKYGVHSLWIDRELQPSEVVFSDFAADNELHDQWVGKLRSPHRFVYGDLRTAEELLELESFDLVFFLGVLYHSAFHLELLAMLNRLTRVGGEMLLETTTDPRPDSAVRVRWQRGTGKAKMVPTFDALRIELAWTGWRDVTVFTDYRPDSDEVLLLCRKTDELAEDADVAGVVRPQRGPASPA